MKNKYITAVLGLCVIGLAIGILSINSTESGRDRMLAAVMSMKWRQAKNRVKVPPPTTVSAPVVTTPSTPATTSVPVVTNPTPTPTTPSTPTPSTNSYPLWGAMVGWQDSALSTFESKIGKPVNTQAVFIHWGNENQFPSSLAAPLKKSGKTLLIYWEAMDYNAPVVTDQPKFSHKAIIRGDWDTYIKSFAEQIKSYGGPVILIPFEEMNGNWYPWSGTMNGNTPADMIAAYRHIHDLFVDVPNVKFGWAVNNDSVPDTAQNKMEMYYPGDAYVDIVGVDGFNFGNPWQTFSEMFGPSLTKLAVYKKPIYIFSMASAAGAQKSAWITDALKTQMAAHPEIKGWIWFNENKEKNWLVWSDAASLSAFQAALP